MTPQEISELSDQRLSEEIAKALGWTDYSFEDDDGEVVHWCAPKGMRPYPCDGKPPNYLSLDALKAGPEGVLRERGWHIVQIIELLNWPGFQVMWAKEGQWVDAIRPTEERARAEASLLGLLA